LPWKCLVSHIIEARYVGFGLKSLIRAADRGRVASHAALRSGTGRTTVSLCRFTRDPVHLRPPDLECRDPMGEVAESGDQISEGLPR
jgi:hypothetical protein